MSTMEVEVNNMNNPSDGSPVITGDDREQKGITVLDELLERELKEDDSGDCFIKRVGVASDDSSEFGLNYDAASVVSGSAFYSPKEISTDNNSSSLEKEFEITLTEKEVPYDNADKLQSDKEETQEDMCVSNTSVEDTDQGTKESMEEGDGDMLNTIGFNAVRREAESIMIVEETDSEAKAEMGVEYNAVEDTSKELDDEAQDSTETYASSELPNSDEAHDSTVAISTSEVHNSDEMHESTVVELPSEILSSDEMQDSTVVESSEIVNSDEMQDSTVVDSSEIVNSDEMQDSTVVESAEIVNSDEMQDSTVVESAEIVNSDEMQDSTVVESSEIPNSDEIQDSTVVESSEIVNSDEMQDSTVVESSEIPNSDEMEDSTVVESSEIPNSDEMEDSTVVESSEIPNSDEMEDSTVVESSEIPNSDEMEDSTVVKLPSEILSSDTKQIVQTKYTNDQNATVKHMTEVRKDVLYLVFQPKDQILISKKDDGKDNEGNIIMQCSENSTSNGSVMTINTGLDKPTKPVTKTMLTVAGSSDAKNAKELNKQIIVKKITAKISKSGSASIIKPAKECEAKEVNQVLTKEVIDHKSEKENVSNTKSSEAEEKQHKEPHAVEGVDEPQKATPGEAPGVVTVKKATPGEAPGVVTVKKATPGEAPGVAPGVVTVKKATPGEAPGVVTVKKVYENRKKSPKKVSQKQKVPDAEDGEAPDRDTQNELSNVVQDEDSVLGKGSKAQVKAKVQVKAKAPISKEGKTVSGEIEVNGKTSSEGTQKRTANFGAVKRKIEEICRVSREEEAAAIEEIKKMKKETLNVLKKINSEMEKLKKVFLAGE